MTDHKEIFYKNIDLANNILFNAKIHPLTTTERILFGNTLSTNDSGIFVFDTDIKAIFVWLGTIWDKLEGSNETNNTICVTTDTLITGQFVNLYSNVGVLSCRLADASDISKLAHGFVLANYTSDATGVIVYLLGCKNTSLNNLTVGAEYWLSDTTQGNLVLLTSIPTNVNHFLQLIGIATSTTSINTYNGQNLIFL